MRPGGLSTAVRLIEPAMLDVFIRIRLDQKDAAAALVAAIQPPVGVRDRSLARLAFLPHHLPCLELDASEQARIVGAIEVAVDKNHAAMVVLHFLGEVDLLRLESAVFGGDPDQSAAR